MAEVFLKVDGVALPCPSSFTWGLQDISASESGRTDDTTMHKNRVGQKRKLSVGWNGPDWDTACKIIQAVNPEYIQVTYPDLLSANKHETRTFYVGDRESPFKCWWKDLVLILSRGKICEIYQRNLKNNRIVGTVTI